jgi:hypothetical protein
MTFGQLLGSSVDLGNIVRPFPEIRATCVSIRSSLALVKQLKPMSLEGQTSSPWWGCLCVVLCLVKADFCM